MDYTQQDPQGLESPGTPTSGGPAGADDSAAVISGLVRTGPWVRFMAVLGFIGVGFMCLGGLVGIVAGLIAGSAMSEFGGGGMGALGALGGVGLGLFYFVMAAISLIFLIPLNRFANNASQLKLNPSLTIAASAIEQNRTYWKRVGVLMIIYLALIPFAIIIAIVAAAMH
jgi:hypothetical protein